MAAIYLIRHAQAPFGSSDYDRLTPLGFEQSAVLGRALRDRLPRADRTIHGDMQRHRLTAETALQELEHRPPLEADAGFREYDHLDMVDRFMNRRALAELGDDAAARKREIERQFVAVMQRWQCGEHDADYAETWQAFQARCLQALQRLTASLVGGQTALLFTSGGVISAIVQDLLRLPLADYAVLNWRLVNAGITKLVLGGGGLHLSTLNEHAHFEGVHTRLLSYR